MKSNIDFDILKYLGKKKLVYWLLKELVLFYLLFLIIFNLRKFKKANAVFVNSLAFGHSVTETSIFFNEYSYDGICISVGSKFHRNKYLKFLYKPHNLLHLWLPNISNINIYHAIRKRTHEIIELAFRESKLFNILTGKKIDVVSRVSMLNSAAVNSLVRDYSYTKDDAIKKLNEFDKSYDLAQSKSFTSLHYLVQQKSLIHYNLSSKIVRMNAEFLNSANFFAIKTYNSNLKICTLVLRKSWKPWSGQGIYSYVKAIDYLKSKSFLINVVGDLDDFHELRKSNVLKDVFCFSDFNLNPKIFQILSIMNSNFCVGDQSGIQALIHFFNKKNLTVNTVPFGQLQYNTVTLPRIWVDKNGFKLSLDEHFNTVLYRIHPTKDIKREPVSPKYYSPIDVLDAVKDFVENNENGDNVTGLDPKKFFNQGLNCMIGFSKNSFFSPTLAKNFD
jgi:putative glycosyltransferase (TIGR04372 family)